MEGTVECTREGHIPGRYRNATDPGEWSQRLKLERIEVTQIQRILKMYQRLYFSKDTKEVSNLRLVA